MQYTGATLKGGVHDDASVQSSTKLYTSKQAGALPVQQYLGAPNRVKKAAPVPPIAKAKKEGQPNKDQPKPEVKLWGRVEDKDEEPDAKPSPRMWGVPQPEPTATAAPKKLTTLPAGNGSTPADGVTSWQPGYAVTRVKMLPPARPGLSGLTGRLIQARPSAKEAVAVQLSLPKHLPANWNEWYDHVAHTIYQVWQQQSVGPGAATIRTIVFDTCDVDCQITDFQPAQDIARNAQVETRFRDAALRSVSSLDKSSVCQFPLVHPKKVTFDVQLGRLVDGPAGCRVIHTNQSDTLTRQK